MDQALRKLACRGVAFMALASAPLLTARAHVLANEKIRITVSETGMLVSVQNLLAAGIYSFRSDTFALETDLALFSNSNTPPARITASQERTLFHPASSAALPNESWPILKSLTAS